MVRFPAGASLLPYSACMRVTVSLVVVCVSKNPKTFLSEMKYVTQMTELEAGQRAMIKAILLRSNRKVSFRYRPWFYVRLQDAVLSGSGLVFLALAFVW